MPNETVQTKTFPAYNCAMAPVECALSIYEKLKDPKNQISGIELRICETDAPWIFRIGQAQYPPNMAEADHNVKYCVAVALLTGSLTPLQYDDKYLQSPDVRGLMDVFEINQMDKAEEAELSCGNAGACKMEVRLKDGTVMRESRARPAGVLGGLPPEERVKQLRAIVDRKRSMLEKSCGYNFEALFKTIFDLEQSNGQLLINEIRNSLHV